MNEEQVKELETLLNYYSFNKAYSEKIEDLEEAKINLAKMWALRAVFDTLGYKAPWEKTEEKCGVEYDYYKLLKDA